MNDISSDPSFYEPLFFKLRVIIIPSVDRVTPPHVQAGVLNSPIQPLDIGNAFGNVVPDFSTKFYTTVIVKSTKDHPVLLHNANLSTIQPFTPNHDKIFSEAADHTAATLADTWFEYK